MGFSAGFSDELEKLALRLPSPQEMMGTAISGPAPAGASQAGPPPEVTALPPAHHVHVHVHGGSGGKSSAGKSKALAALPKPPQDAPRPVDASRLADSSTSAGSAPGLPPAPAFGADSKATSKTYTATGPTPGRHTVGYAASRGTQLPSQMNLGPRWIEDTGEGPTRAAAMTPQDLLGGIAQASKPAQMAPGQNFIPTAPIKNNAYSGLQYGPSRVEPTLQPVQNGSVNGRAIGIQQIDSPGPVTRSRKKMLGAALAPNEGPTKI